MATDWLRGIRGIFCLVLDYLGRAEAICGGMHDSARSRSRHRRTSYSPSHIAYDKVRQSARFLGPVRAPRRDKGHWGTASMNDRFRKIVIPIFIALLCYRIHHSDRGPARSNCAIRGPRLFSLCVAVWILVCSRRGGVWALSQNCELLRHPRRSLSCFAIHFLVLDDHSGVLAG